MQLIFHKVDMCFKSKKNKTLDLKCNASMLLSHYEYIISSSLPILCLFMLHVKCQLI